MKRILDCNQTATLPAVDGYTVITPNERAAELQRRGVVAVTLATALQLLLWMLALVVA